VSAVDALTTRRTFFTDRAAQVLLNGYSMDKSVPDPQSRLRNRLTARERQVVQLIADAKTSKDVASTLGISVKTAETHRANIMRKLELHSVSEVVRYALQNRIVET
jgi:DNA-binding NarL/FixJ family response regulator